MSRVLALLCLSGCSVVLHQVSDLEDRRAASELEAIARVGDAEVRQRALLALGRIQDPRSAPVIIAALKGDVPEVREEAAFAAGLLGLSWQPLPDDVKLELADALLALEPSPRVVEALGRLATPEALKRLLERFPTDDRAALALGIAMKRGAKFELPAPTRPPRYGQTYLFAMAKRAEAKGPLTLALSSEDPEIRALAAKGLGDAGGDPALLRAALADADVRVAVEAARSLIKLKAELPASIDREPVLLAVAQAGVAVQTDKLPCRMAMARDRKLGALNESAKCGALALHVLAEGEVKDTAAIEPKLSGSPAEQLGALDALGAAKAIALAPKIRPLLESKDFILAAGAANALAKMGDKESIPAMRKLAAEVLVHEDIAPAVADALTELDAKQAVPELTAWLQSSNATVRHTAAAALSKLTGVKTSTPDLALSRASPMPETGRGLLIETEKGEVEIALWNDEAPRTAGNLWTLAKTGYFDGLTFHRIVPDFVAQAGDPRGDGEGGPGYLIRCEIGHRPYVRGTVGMALSGKDTGGSQFFITHTATPHLDGKYTAFGQVVRGMEVVDQLLEGDRMLKVTVLP